jgi:hypothetical protein
LPQRRFSFILSIIFKSWRAGASTTDTGERDETTGSQVAATDSSPGTLNIGAAPGLYFPAPMTAAQLAELDSKEAHKLRLRDLGHLRASGDFSKQPIYLVTLQSTARTTAQQQYSSSAAVQQRQQQDQQRNSAAVTATTAAQQQQQHSSKSAVARSSTAATAAEQQSSSSRAATAAQ